MTWGDLKHNWALALRRVASQRMVRGFRKLEGRCQDFRSQLFLGVVRCEVYCSLLGWHGHKKFCFSQVRLSPAEHQQAARQVWKANREDGIRCSALSLTLSKSIQGSSNGKRRWTVLNTINTEASSSSLELKTRIFSTKPLPCPVSPLAHDHFNTTMFVPRCRCPSFVAGSCLAYNRASRWANDSPTSLSTFFKHSLPLLGCSICWSFLH